MARIRTEIAIVIAAISGCLRKLVSTHFRYVCDNGDVKWTGNTGNVTVWCGFVSGKDLLLRVEKKLELRNNDHHGRFFFDGNLFVSSSTSSGLKLNTSRHRKKKKLNLSTNMHTHTHTYMEFMWSLSCTPLVPLLADWMRGKREWQKNTWGVNRPTTKFRVPPVDTFAFPWRLLWEVWSINVGLMSKLYMQQDKGYS